METDVISNLLKLKRRIHTKAFEGVNDNFKKQ